MKIQTVVKRAAFAALEAGRVIMRVRACGFGVHYKSDCSPVTAADTEADRKIREILSAAFPQIPFLTEETADDAAARMASGICFIVDPLDGTKEFVRGREEFTVNIALAEGDRPVMGVIYVPCMDVLYFAAEGRGAYRLEEASSHPLSEAVKIHVSDRTEAPVLLTGHTGAAKVTDACPDVTVKAMGSSLKGCFVADGHAELCVCPHPTHEWDTAAMQCICTEAGAVMRLYDGSVPRCNQADTVNHGGFYILNREENRHIVDKLLGM